MLPAEAPHVPGDGLDHRGEPLLGLGDVGRDVLHNVDAGWHNHGVGTKTADNVRAATILFLSCLFDHFFTFIHNINSFSPRLLFFLCRLQTLLESFADHH